MKTLLYLANFVFLFTSCNCQKSVTTNSNLVENPKSNYSGEVAQTDLPIIEYGASSRGYLFAMKVENQVLEYTQKAGHIPDRDLKGFENKVQISDSDWKEIVALLKVVKLEEVKDYKWPTEKRYYDGAPYANITFIHKGEKYPANGFDHGYPPVQIEKLVNKLMSYIPKI